MPNDKELCTQYAELLEDLVLQHPNYKGTNLVGCLWSSGPFQYRPSETAELNWSMSADIFSAYIRSLLEERGYSFQNSSWSFENHSSYCMTYKEALLDALENYSSEQEEEVDESVEQALIWSWDIEDSLDSIAQELEDRYNENIADELKRARTALEQVQSWLQEDS